MPSSSMFRLLLALTLPQLLVLPLRLVRESRFFSRSGLREEASAFAAPAMAFCTNAAEDWVFLVLAVAERILG